jgi:peptidoglycan/LPS O-acetylase OafA/YrhL
LIGNASYSLYLTHAYVIQALQKKVMPLDAFTPAQVALMLLAVALCCALAVACFLLVERPSNLWLRRRLLRRSRAAALGATQSALGRSQADCAPSGGSERSERGGIISRP